MKKELLNVGDKIVVFKIFTNEKIGQTVKFAW